jgi:sec-independent protein translocase protein TatC
MGFQVEALDPNITAAAYLGLVTRLLLAFGLVFELPVVILVLAMLGIVTPEMLTTIRRHAYATITVMACVLTPGDVASSLFMMVPLFLLYELSIVLSRVFGRRSIMATEPAVEA